MALSASVPGQIQADQIDPVTSSPNMYRLLFENAHVRVVRYQIEPGDKDEWHTHPAKVSYIVTGGTLRITTADGNSFVVDESTDSASWLGAIGKHHGENIGTDTVRIVFVEIKSVDEVWNGKLDRQ
ncbi:MAG: cytoplasmic protein [Woeseiaceae bacterium]